MQSIMKEIAEAEENEATKRKKQKVAVVKEKRLRKKWKVYLQPKITMVIIMIL